MYEEYKANRPDTKKKKYKRLVYNLLFTAILIAIAVFVVRWALWERNHKTEVQIMISPTAAENMVTASPLA